MAKHSAPTRSAVGLLARWMLSTPASVIPAAVIEQARLLLLDTLGCGIAGQQEEVSHSVLAMVDELGGAEQCSVIGRTRKTSLLNAILANGCLIRVLDLNDYIGGAAGGGPEFGGHPSDNIPVALAVGEARRKSGGDILAAIVLGYEVFGRLKSLMGHGTTWDEVTVSGIAAPAIAGRLMDMAEERLAHGIALGAARAATPGIVRAGHISAAKSIANALVAQSGVQGALLATHGATGPLDVLNGPRGMQELFSKGDAAELLSAPFPDQPYIMRAHVKMYPCLGTGQGAVAAGLALHRQLGRRIAEIEHIEVAMADYPMVKRQQVDPERIHPKSREAADHSFNFLAAVALIDGSFGLRQYENERWLDPQVTGLMDKLVMSTDPGLNERAPGAFSCRLSARTRDGQEHVAEVLYPPGYSRGGLDRDTVTEKFHAVTADRLDAAGRARVLQAVLGFADAASPDVLMTALRG